MKNCRSLKYSFFVLLLFSFIMSSVVVDAHPGRLDSNGGHYNRKTGEYHYHRGGGSSSGGTATQKTAQNKKTTTKQTTPTTKRTTTKSSDPQTASSNANQKLKINHFFLEDEIARVYKEENTPDALNKITDEQRKAIIAEYNSAKETNTKRSQTFGATIKDSLEKKYYQEGVLRNMMLKACREIAKKYGIQAGDVYNIANNQ